jgi:hypothetical protein
MMDEDKSGNTTFFQDGCKRSILGGEQSGPSFEPSFKLPWLLKSAWIIMDDFLASEYLMDGCLFEPS